MADLALRESLETGLHDKQHDFRPRQIKLAKLNWQLLENMKHCKTLAFHP